jgi:hypothetical protein
MPWALFYVDFIASTGRTGAPYIAMHVIQVNVMRVKALAQRLSQAACVAGIAV